MGKLVHHLQNNLAHTPIKLLNQSDIHFNISLSHRDSHHAHQFTGVETLTDTFVQFIIKMEFAVLHIGAEVEVLDLRLGGAPFAQFDVVGGYHAGSGKRM